MNDPKHFLSWQRLGVGKSPISCLVESVMVTVDYGLWGNVNTTPAILYSSDIANMLYYYCSCNYNYCIM